MADAKITALTENTTPLSTDITVIVDDPAGTPVTQKITLANLVSDASITLSDVTTNNASTTKHGFAPKATAPAANLLNVPGITNGETVYSNKALLASTTPSTQAYGDSAVVGTSLEASHADHKHAMPAALGSTAGIGNTPTASGTVTVTHGLGRTPIIIRIKSGGGFTSNASATPTTYSMGIWNASGNFCIYQGINGTTTIAAASSNTFAIYMITSAGNLISGVIQNVGATTFDIAFTETGTHTRGVYMWEAQ